MYGLWWSAHFNTQCVFLQLNCVFQEDEGNNANNDHASGDNDFNIELPKLSKGQV